MNIGKIRVTSLLLVSTLTFSTSSFTFAQSPGYHTGNKTLDSVFDTYKNTLSKQGDKVKAQLLDSDIAQLSSQTISSDLKDRLMQNQIDMVAKANLATDVSQAIANSTEQKSALKQLVSSLKKERSQEYRLFLKTNLSQSELSDTLSFFDNVNLKLVSTSEDGKSVYEVTFSYTGRLAKLLGNKLSNGEIPANLFENVEVVKPMIIKNLVSTGTYLSGESVSSLWGMRAIGATDYQYGLSKGTKIKVGVIDTGTTPTHTDLAANATAGYSFLNSTTNATDDNGHGTHVSGIIGGSVNARGVFGVDSNVTIVPLKVLDASGYGSSYAIVDAINYAANNGVRVINMSLGGSGSPTGNILCTAITNAKNKGTISVVAAGNENTNVSNVIPAGCSDAITVGAVDSTLTKASFSNYGDKVDVAAPGVNIYSTYLNNSYATMNGTSMATPYVTGLVAAILSKNPSYTTEQVKSILKDSANSTAVTSSVNIGRFISMSKVMTSLGVQNDTYIGNDPTTGSGSTGSGTTGSGGTSSGITTPVYAPQLSLSATNLETNKYRITANAYETGGTIVSYTFLNGSALLYSGTTNTYDIAIAQNTTITVVAKDARGEGVSKTINLTYTAPTTPVYTPQLTVSAINLGNNTYQINASAYETGGTIVSYTFANGNTILYTGSASSYLLKIAQNTIITVSAKDARGVSVSKTVELKYTAPTTPVYTPQLTVSTISLGNNTYRVYASAYEINGKIVSYAFKNGSTLLYSGALSYYQLAITQNTTLTVSATDARGVSVSKTVSLAYTAPKPNVAPTVTLSNTSMSNVLNRLTIGASDSDGKIARIDVYVNGVKKYYMQPNTSSISALLLLTKGNYTIRVVATDDKGATAEKSITLSK